MERKTENLKSDVPAKTAYRDHLLANGFSQAAIAAAPSDVIAVKDGVPWFFEIKYTRQKNKCFGAATLNEWIQATKDPEHFRFVVAYNNGGVWEFREYTPAEFIEHSYIPPFKIYFNVAVGLNSPNKAKRGTNAVRMTLDRLAQMEQLYKMFKDDGA